jgi:hypothetical protein
MGKKSGSGIRIRNKQPGSYFRELKKKFGGLNLKFFDADPGSGMEKFGSGIRVGKRKKVESGIQDKHPGSATLQKSDK